MGVRRGGGRPISGRRGGGGRTQLLHDSRLTTTFCTFFPSVPRRRAHSRHACPAGPAFCGGDERGPRPLASGGRLWRIIGVMAMAGTQAGRQAGSKDRRHGTSWLPLSPHAAKNVKKITHHVPPRLATTRRAAPRPAHTTPHHITLTSHIAFT
ncbi:hypothetical protein E2C01_033028 [Portunus trituberculatus]|uniref:Uncharacterized protein n=1 Tax=Portunus trituberculatus TaxID=210409 RepID=A0A5B7F2N5_PORTR|nr:hypothetical protein [Portunus trituberculatus]